MSKSMFLNGREEIPEPGGRHVGMEMGVTTEGKHRLHLSKIHYSHIQPG